MEIFTNQNEIFYNNFCNQNCHRGLKFIFYISACVCVCECIYVYVCYFTGLPTFRNKVHSRDI